MKRLNKRLVVGTACVLLALAVFSRVLLLRCSGLPNVEPFLAAAAQRVAAGDVDDALVRYRRILQFHPKCAAAHIALGELLERRGEFRNVAEHYAMALKLRPGDADTARRLGRAAERLGANALLREAAESLLAVAPEDGEGHYWKALFLGANRKHGPAIAEAEKACASPNPHLKLRAMVLLGQLHGAEGEFALCDKAYEAALAVDPENRELLLALAQLYEGRKDKAQSVEKARTFLERAVAAHPDAVEPRLHIASLLVRQSQLDAAEAHLKAAMERNPGDKASLGAYADFLVRSGRFADARRHLESSLESLKVWPEGRARLIDVLLDLGETGAARDHFAKLPPAPEDSATGKYLEGRLLTAEGRPSEAIGKFKEVIARSPRRAEVHFYQGVAYLGLGELGSARASFEEAARRDPFALGPQRQIAAVALALGDPDAAVDAARRVLAVEPQDASTRRLLARAYAVRGNLAAAAEELEAVLKGAAEPVEVTLELARLRSATGQPQEAVRLIQTLPSEARSSSRACLALARVYLDSKNVEKARVELAEALRKAPREVELRTALGFLEIGAGRAAEAGGIADELAAGEPSSVRAQMAASELYERLGLLAKALEACRRAEALEPGNVEVSGRLIDLLLVMSRPDDALAAAKRLARAKPERLSAQLAVPRVLVATREWASAITALEELARSHPHEALPADLLGRAYFGAGSLRRAREHLRKAAGLRPDWLDTCHLLADVCYRSGEYQEAITWSERILQRRPDMRSARLLSALSHAQQDAYSRAIEEYVAAEPREPEPGYYIGLASLYERDGKQYEAEKALLRARQLQPDSPTTVFALVRHYAMVGTPARADALIAELSAKAQREPGMLVVIGRQRAASGRVAEAEKAFRAAIQADPKSASLRVVLGDLLRSVGRAAEAREAYREAAELGSMQGRSKIVESLCQAGCLAEAWAELGSARGAGTEAILRVAEARLLLAEAAHQAPGEKLAACQAACEAALRADPGNAEAHLVLSESYLAERPARREAALAALQRAARLAGGGPSAISVRLANLLLDVGRPEEAERECRRALAMAPALSSALETLAVAIGKSKRGMARQAIAELLAKEFPANPARHVLLGDSLAAQRRWQEASSEYRAGLAEAPGMVRALAGLTQALVGAGEAAAAADECHRFLQANPGNVVCLEVLGHVHLASKQASAAAEAYEAASRLDPGEHRFVAQAARAHLASGNPAKASACCQAYIARWPRDPRGAITLGSLLAAQGKAAEAEREFAKALELDPRSLDALGSFAEFCTQHKRYDAALNACNAFLKKWPNNAHALQLAARVQIERGDLAAAQASLEAAVGSDGTLLGPRFDLASLRLRRGQFDQGAAEFREILSSQPDRADVLNNLAWCLAEAGRDLDQAKAIAARALAIAPDMPNALDTYGWICFRRKEYDEACNALRRSLELRPDSVASRYHLGAVLAAQGKRAEAVAELTHALASETPVADAEAARALLKSLSQTAPPPR